MVTAEWLKKAELFGSLNESQLNDLLFHSAVKPFPEGETLFRQDEEARCLYVLVDGLIELSVKTGGEIAFLTSRIEKEGEVLGVSSLIEPFRYSVTAKCLKPSNVLIFEANYINNKINEDARMGMEIMKKLAFIYFNRLNELRAGVSNLVKFLKLKTP